MNSSKDCRYDPHSFEAADSMLHLNSFTRNDTVSKPFTAIKLSFPWLFLGLTHINVISKCLDSLKASIKIDGDFAR